MSNTIDSNLQLTEILDAAIDEFDQHIFPLMNFSTSIGRANLNGDGTVTVPYYPMETTTSGTRAEGEAYSTKVGNTTTSAKQVTPNKNKIQGLSFTPEEVSRQPMLDTEKHGRKKARKLALDVLQDIFSIVRRSNFGDSGLGAVDPAAFDEADIRALRKQLNTAKFPADGRSCWLDSELYTEILGDTTVLDMSQSGSGDVLREGMLPRMFGFGMGEALGMGTNDGVATSCTATNATNLFTDAGHDLVNGDVVQIGGTATPTGVSAATDYYVISATTDTFQISATAGGAAVTFSDDGTAVTYQRFERIGGFVAYESAILTAFAPVPPTAGIRQKLVDYQEVESERTGLILEYKHIADEDKSIEYQIIECHYGYALGQPEALLRIEKQEA